MLIAAALPVLDLLIVKRVIKLRVIIAVFIIPFKKRKDFASVLVISEEINVDCPEPKAGRNENKVETIAEEKRSFRNSFFGIFISFKL